MPQPESHIFCFGLGFSARCLATSLMAEGWRVSGTCRSAEKQAKLASGGITAFRFTGEPAAADMMAALASATHVLSSVPPDADGDPVLRRCGDAIGRIDGLRWAGYLSTTGVYGDTGGASVDESSPLKPTSDRAQRRVNTEEAWLELGRRSSVDVHVFRLAGIYGPGRSALDQARAGTARRIDRPDQLFSRIHVEDIAAVLRASMARPDSGAVYNVCDDEPAAPADVVTFACELLDIEPPPRQTYDDAAADMSPMALSFWRDNRRVENKRIKDDLGIELRYPDYRAGLRAILAAE